MKSVQKFNHRINLQPTLHSIMHSRSAFIILFILMNCVIQAQTDSLKYALGKLGKVPLAQSDSAVNPTMVRGSGNVNIVADSAIVSLERGTRKFKETKGYRIQIYLGTVSESNKERNKYLSLGLPYSIYSKQIVPEQALQVGDFINRMEMEKHLEIIKKHYPKAFGVVSFIEPPKFNTSRKTR